MYEHLESSTIHYNRNFHDFEVLLIFAGQFTFLFEFLDLHRGGQPCTRPKVIVPRLAGGSQKLGFGSQCSAPCPIFFQGIYFIEK